MGRTFVSGQSVEVVTSLAHFPLLSIGRIALGPDVMRPHIDNVTLNRYRSELSPERWLAQ